MSNSSLLWSAVHQLFTSDDHNVCGTDNHVGKCYSCSPCSRNVQCNIVFWLGCTLLNMNIDEAWQLWENTFMAITWQCFPKGVLPTKMWPWVTAGTRNTILYTASWSNNPNLRAEYKQLCSKVVSQLQNAKQSHALTSCNPVCKLAGTIASYPLNQAAWSKPVHLYYQPCTAAEHLLASYSKLCSTFHHHASPSTSQL